MKIKGLKDFWKEKRKDHEEKGGKKLLKKGSHSIFATIILIALLLFANLITGELPSPYRQIDFSKQKLYSISSRTIEFLKTLDQDVTIYQIAQSGKEDATINKMLENYKGYSKHIKVVTKDPVVNPNFVSRFTKEELAENSLIVESKSKNKILAYNNLYKTEVDYTTYQETVTGFDGEGQLTSAIDFVVSDNLPVLYTLEGHGESEMPSTVKTSVEKENIETRSLNPLTEGKIPADAKTIYICSPTSDFTAEEVKIITDYLENGGNAIIFSDYREEKLKNFEKIIQNYGIESGKGLIFEGDSSHFAYQRPFYLVPNLGESQLVKGLEKEGKYVLMPQAQGVTSLKEKRNTITLTPILTTSKDSYRKTDVENIDSYDKKAGDQEGPFTLAMDIVEKAGEKTSHLIYYSSSSLLNDQIDTMVSGGNTELITASVTSLCKNGDEMSSSISIAEKTLDSGRLTMTAFHVSMWTLFTVIFLPGMVLIWGLLVWLKRRKL